MGLGRRRESRQQELWIAADQLGRTPRHVFYEKLNRVLAQAKFDAWVEARCRPYYAEEGRRSIPPGVYFRMLLVGYFEGIDSQRGIAWRCADSRSLQSFLGYGLTESTPDHSSLTKIRERLPVELYAEVFQFVLKLVEQHKLLTATVVGVDSTTLEANAAMKSIVRKDTGENWNEYVTRLMREEGVIEPDEAPSAEELRRFDRGRKDKKVSNDEWQHPHDPEAQIAKLKDGRTHLAYKAEHVVDLQTEAILAAEVYAANAADTATLVPSLQQAQANVSATESGRTIEKAAADKGYHAADTLVACQEFDLLGVKTYIPEPRGRRRWTDKTEEQKAAVLQNRARTQRAYGKRLQRKRSELVERSFAHVCDTGGSRRSWLRGLTNVRKRHLVAAAAHNLGLILRKLVGAGKPRAFHDLLRALATLDFAQVTRRSMLSNLYAANLSHPLPTVLATR
ncbi:MAG: transposase [Pirellulales bacterium]